MSNEILGIPVENGVIQKYMSFDRFVSAISNKGLWVSRLDKFEDPWEGAIPKMNIEEFQKSTSEKISVSVIEELYSANSSELRDILDLLEIDQSQFLNPEIKVRILPLFAKLFLYADCWFRSEEDSISMWKSFGSGPNSLKIISKIDSVHKFFSEYESKFSSSNKKYKRGDIKYLDYFKDRWDEKRNPFMPAFHKRSVYSHEREYRSIIQLDKINGASGFYVPVNFDDVIDIVVLSPTTSKSFEESIVWILKNANIDAFVQKSELFKPPHY